MYPTKTRARARHAKLVLALLGALTVLPAYAGQTCDLIDGDVGVEDAGGSTANGDTAVACGINNTANGTRAVAVGNNNFATGERSIAVGFAATAAGPRSIVIGTDSVADGADSIAIGSQSQATAEGSVALGSGAVADRANTVSVGAAGAERQITNVAAGTQDTDAANVSQLNKQAADTLASANAYTDSKFGALPAVNDRFDAVDSRMNRIDARIDRLDSRVDRIGAMGGALAGMAMNASHLSGQNRVAVGVGSQNGRQALAFGYQRALMDNRASVSLGAAFSGGDNTISGGAGFSW